MTPAISIIMPMYNMEIYINECLDSILAQKFKNYEVIVVDDCSTDKSCAIVESYVSKFNKKMGGVVDRLRLIRSDKNSGGHVGVPRNKGMELARGKYLYFLDSDDALIDTALEELFNAAEKFHADIVHSNQYFQSPGETATTNRKLLAMRFLEKEDNLSKSPVLLDENSNERIKKFINLKIRWEPWTNFFRREFLQKYNLKFPLLSICDDMIFFLTTLLLAKNVVMMPDAYYIWRTRENSNSRKERSPEQSIKKVGRDFIHGVAFMENFFTTHKIFEDNPEEKFNVYSFFANWQLPVSSTAYAQAPMYELDALVRDEIKQLDDAIAPAALFFDYMNALALQVNALRYENATLRENLNRLGQ